MKRKLLPFLGLFVLLSFTLPFENDYWLEFITNQLNKYVEIYPQQKVYLQLDSDEYETGGTIWYKAYVLNDTEKSLEDRSKNLYVELISPTKKVFMNRLLKIENGLAHGEFPVHDTIRTGMYSIRGYTRNMKNYGKEYLFEKSIRINNPEKVYYNKDFHREAKKANKTNEDIDLQFFPEGGDFVASLETKVAFKAINNYGKAVDVEGRIINSHKQVVANFKSNHKGMGTITLKPELKTKYHAEIVTDKGKKMKFDLPEVLEKGYNLNVSKKGEELDLVIKTNKTFSGDPVAKTVYVFLQNGGKIYHSSKHMFEKEEIRHKISAQNLPSGIQHITLFDGQGKPQCERLVFIEQDDELKINSSKVSSVQKKGKVEFEIDVDKNSNADLSLAVRKKAETGLEFGHGQNIRNYMLLQADLRGYIENPDYYFSKTTDAIAAMDLVMLTHGWRKFDWENVLVDSIEAPEFEVEKDLRVTGRITKYFFDISVKEASVKMTLLNKFNDVYKDISKEKGRFEFTGLEYSDTMDVLIEARTKWGRKNILIIPDEDPELLPVFKPLTGFYLDSLLVKRKPEYKKYKEPENEDEGFKLHGKPDQVIYFNDDPSISSSMSVMDAIRGRVAGLNVGPNSASMRGVTSGVSNSPLYLIDGMRASYDAVQSIPTADVERVEILKGPSAAIYGLGSAGGVIAIYTKHGFRYKRGEIRFKMLGYHTPKKFYSPKYDGKNNKSEEPDLRKTIYWNPKVKLDKNGKAKIEFYHSDIAGDFEVIIEGMSNNGKFGINKFEYTVKDFN